MQTIHPHAQSFNSSPLNDVISFSRAYAEDYANSEAKAILPVIMPYTEWIGHWDFAWNSAFAYASEGLTTNQLYRS